MTFHYGYILTPRGKIIPMPEPAHGNGTFSLIQLQEAVGGYIELIHPAWIRWTELMKPFGLEDPDTTKPPQFIFLVDEDGVSKELSPNFAAGKIGHDGWIFGNLVVIPEDTME